MVSVSTSLSAEQATWFAERYRALVANVETFIRGKNGAVQRALTCLLAEGHLLVEDVPGTAKTSLAKALAHSIDGSVRRISCTPDLLPSDVTGVSTFNQQSREFEFHPGAVFANVVLADEINRASPKTQAALLEVMAERQVTVDSVPYAVPLPFLVMATQNPVEMDGTYRLPEAQIDRFMMRMEVGYPSAEAEVEVMANHAAGYVPEQIRPVVTSDEMLQMMEIARQVYVAPPLRHYIVSVTDATRRLPELSLGVSPRGSIALEAAARVRALTQGRSYVTPDDIKLLAEPVLAHRMLLRPEAELAGTDAAALLQTILAAAPVPQDRVEAAQW